MGDMFQKKTDELFSSMLNVFGIADDILIPSFDEWGKGHDEMLEVHLIQFFHSFVICMVMKLCALFPVVKPLLQMF